MTDYVIAYTGPRGGKPKYQVVPGEDPKSAMNRFIESTEKTYVEQVYAPVDAATAPPAEATPDVDREELRTELHAIYVAYLDRHVQRREDRRGEYGTTEQIQEWQQQAHDRFVKLYPTVHAFRFLPRGDNHGR
jgi:hypothetical protein